MLKAIVVMCWASAAVAQPVVRSVLNAGSLDGRLSPGVVATIFGQGFGVPAGQLSATVGGQPAPLIPPALATQFSVQFPFTLSTGPAAVVVTAGGQRSAPFAVTLDTHAPAFFSSGPIFFNPANGSLYTASSPAAPGGQVTTFAVGLGPTNPPVAAGAVATAIAPTVAAATLMVGGKAAVIAFAGFTPGVPPGVYQVGFAVPRDVTAGNQEVLLSIGGKQSQSGVMLPTTMGVPSIAGVRHGATFLLKEAARGAAPNSFVSLYATNLGNTDTQQSLFPATAFQGVSVLFNGTPAPLYFVFGSAGQINLVTPSELPETGTVSVTVRNSIGLSQTLSLAMAPLDVGIFRIADPSNRNRQNGAVLIANTAWRVMPASMAAALGFRSCAGLTAATACGQPAAVGDSIQIYYTGGGKATPDGDPARPPLATGTVAPADGSVIYRTVVQPAITIGGVAAPVLFSGIAPGNAGLYQVNTTIPAGVPAGDDVPVVMTMGNSSDTATIAVR
jgi:uncharacterized protein (TIGR03437 family)